MTVCTHLGESIRDCARRKGDERILNTLLFEDAVAKDVLYHRSCFKAYTRVKSFDRSDTATLDPYEMAFKKLKVAIQTSLDNNALCTLKDLLAVYQSHLQDYGIHTPYKSDRLKQRIMKQFGDSRDSIDI